MAAMKAAFHRLAQRAKSTVAGLTRPSIDQEFIRTAPDPQHALDIFKGEWLSALPSPLSPCRAGTLPLFGDPRIQWAVERWGGVQGQKVIELGPLEGGHSWMLEQMGAAEVIAIEASTRAWLKCLTLKELTGMTRVRFLCGDSVAYLRENPARADAIVASGILYHMSNPVELIAEIAAHTDRMFLWTCYYDEAMISARPMHRGEVRSAPIRHARGIRPHGPSVSLPRDPLPPGIFRRRRQPQPLADARHHPAGAPSLRLRSHRDSVRGAGACQRPRVRAGGVSVAVT